MGVTFQPRSDYFVIGLLPGVQVDGAGVKSPVLRVVRAVRVDLSWN